MIDEKRLIEKLENMIGMMPTCYLGKANEQNAYLDAIIRTLSTVKRQPKIGEWIPVEERLPEEKGEYLVTYHPCVWDTVFEEIRVGTDSFRGKNSWAKKNTKRLLLGCPIRKHIRKDKKYRIINLQQT